MGTDRSVSSHYGLATAIGDSPIGPVRRVLFVRILWEQVMNTSAALLLCALSTGPVLGYSAAKADCQPQVVDQSAQFPTRAISRGQQGTVLMDVLIEDSGRAAAVEVVDSSGYRLLDQAAKETALTQWEFDVSTCERKDLPVRHRVGIEYRNGQ
jgi:TonB family protein